jgi:hypothetical protein
VSSFRIVPMPWLSTVVALVTFVTFTTKILVRSTKLSPFTTTWKV